MPAGGFDAVVCLGNSFAHLPDFTGRLGNQKVALENFHAMVKPGGILVIDHRNYDAILDTGSVPAKNVYYNVSKIAVRKTYQYRNRHSGSISDDTGMPILEKRHSWQWEFPHVDTEFLFWNSVENLVGHDGHIVMLYEGKLSWSVLPYLSHAVALTAK